MLDVVVVVNSLILARHQRTDLGCSFGANFRYWLIRESLILPHFQPWEWGLLIREMAYTRVYMVCVKYHCVRMTAAFY